MVDNGIEAGVEIIEKVDHLQWSAGSSDARETHNVTVRGRHKEVYTGEVLGVASPKVDGDTLKGLGSHSLSSRQLHRDGPGQHAAHQVLRLLFLCRQLAGPLCHYGLQVGRILLQL